MAFRYDHIGRLESCTRTDAGFVRVKARLTRTGVLPYATAGGYRRELRHPDDVFHPASLETAGSGLPITIGHLGAITPSNVGAKVGQTRSDVWIEDEKYLCAELQIEDASALARIDSGELCEISAGYRADNLNESGKFEGEPYDSRQVNIRYNHLALLPKGHGRAGSEVGLRFDAADDVGYSTSMDLVEIKIGDQTFSVPAEVAAEIARLSGMAQGQAEGEQAAQEILTVVVEDAPEDKADAIEAAVTERLALVERVRAAVPEFKYAGEDKLTLMRTLLGASGVKADGKDESWMLTALEVLPQLKVAAPVKETAALKVDSTETIVKPAPTPEQLRAERDARREQDPWKR